MINVFLLMKTLVKCPDATFIKEGLHLLHRALSVTGLGEYYCTLKVVRSFLCLFLQKIVLTVSSDLRQKS